jgi:hypothetical protein
MENSVLKQRSASSISASWMYWPQKLSRVERLQVAAEGDKPSRLAENWEAVRYSISIPALLFRHTRASQRISGKVQIPEKRSSHQQVGDPPWFFVSRPVLDQEREFAQAAIRWYQRFLRMRVSILARSWLTRQDKGFATLLDRPGLHSRPVADLLPLTAQNVPFKLAQTLDRCTAR